MSKYNILLFGFRNPSQKILVEKINYIFKKEKLIHIKKELDPEILSYSICAIIDHDNSVEDFNGNLLLSKLISNDNLPKVIITSNTRFDELKITGTNIEICFHPIVPSEIKNRLEISLKRTKKRSDLNNRIDFDNLSINLDKYEVWLDGNKLNLTFKEYELLKYLASNPGRVFSREILLKSIWSDDYIGGTRTVDVHIRRIRSKIDDLKNQFIETQWNVGYKFRNKN